MTEMTPYPSGSLGETFYVAGLNAEQIEAASRLVSETGCDPYDMIKLWQKPPDVLSKELDQLIGYHKVSAAEAGAALKTMLVGIMGENKVDAKIARAKHRKKEPDIKLEGRWR